MRSNVNTCFKRTAVRLKHRQHDAAAKAAPGKALTPAEREERAAEIELQLLDAERQEASLVWTAPAPCLWSTARPRARRRSWAFVS